MNKISLNMIIGNREEQYLEHALQSTKWVDEHIIVNTGDEDNKNLDMVKKILPNAKIVQFTGKFSFSEARNLALSNSTMPWILWQDADEVHFDRFEGLVRGILPHTNADGVNFGFYHFILDMFHYQSIDMRIILFRHSGKKWVGSVHEKVGPFSKIIDDDYRYHHYGYTKPQKEIYENWRLYWSLKSDERWKLDEYRDANNIVSDRVTVAHQYEGHYPEIMKEYIMQQHSVIEEYKFKE